MIFSLINLATRGYVATNNIAKPSGINVEGIIFATASGEVVHPIKKNPSATVDGKVRIIPAIFLLTFSAIKDNKAINPPPTRNEIIS